MNIRKHFEDTLTTFRAVLQAFDEDVPSDAFNGRVVEILDDDELAESYLERANANIADALLCRFEGNVCFLFERNWIDPLHAQHQLRKSGMSALEAVRVIGRGPIRENAMSDEDKQLIFAVVDGLLIPNEAIRAKAERETCLQHDVSVSLDSPKKHRSADLNVSEVAEILAVRRGTVLAHIQAGKLRAYNAALPGKKENWRITPLALDEFRSGDSVQLKPDSKRSGMSRPTHIEEFF